MATTAVVGKEKIIRAKEGLAELAKWLDNVSQAHKMINYGGDSSDRFKEHYAPAADWRSRKGAEATQADRLKNRTPPKVEAIVFEFSRSRIPAAVVRGSPARR